VLRSTEAEWYAVWGVPATAPSVRARR